MYELTIVLAGDTTPAKAKSFTEEVESIVVKSKGKVVKKADWGTIDLAYKIAKNVSGKFLYFELELPVDAVTEFDYKILHTPSVIRHLLIKTNK